MAAAASISGWPVLGPAKAEAKAGSSRVRVWSGGTAPRSVDPDDVGGAITDHLRRQGGLDVK